MSTTIYRQHRPQTFSEVFGQNHIKIVLTEEIKRQQIASAYLFCGPRAVGKTTIARLLAKSLNCLDRPTDSAEPCNQCSSCQAVVAGQSLDIIEVDAASQTGVDNVRDNIIANSRIAPSGKYKVFIIDEVHMLSTSSFNALLKTIEEPPPQVLFILCTTEVHKIPATVISRCERFDFKKITTSDIVKKLRYILKQENWLADDLVLSAIAKNSQGHLRDAESLLGQLIAISQAGPGNQPQLTIEDFYLLSPTSDLSIISQFLKTLAEQNSVEAITIINQLVSDGRDLRIFLQDLIEILRQLMLSKINPQLLPDYQSQWGGDKEAFGLIDLRQQLTINRLVQFLQLFIQAANEIKDSFIIQLPLELAVVKALSLDQPSSSSVPTQPSPLTSKTDSVKSSKKTSQSSPSADKSQSGLTKDKSDSSVTKSEVRLKDTKKEVKKEIEKGVNKETEEDTKVKSISTKDQSKADLVKDSKSISKSEVVDDSKKEIPIEISLSEQELVDKWPEVLARVKNHNAGLSVVLKACQPIIKDNQVNLMFCYKFHQQQAQQIKIKHLLEEILLEVYSQPLTMVTELLDNQVTDNNSTATQATVDDLLEVFNGKIVNDN